MKNILSILIITIIATLSYSCGSDNGVETIKNSNDKDHSFELIQGNQWSYDIASGVARDSIDIEFASIASVGTPDNIGGKECFKVNDFRRAFKYTSFATADFAYTDKDGYYIYSDMTSGNVNSLYLFGDRWLKLIDFKNLNWDIVDTTTNIMVEGQEHEINISLSGKRLEVLDVYYKGKVYRGLKTELHMKSSSKNLVTFETVRVNNKTETISVAEIGIYQTKSYTPGNPVSYFSILTNEKLN